MPLRRAERARAGLIERAEHWRWSSLWWHTASPSPQPGPALSVWPVERPDNWVHRVNAALSPAEEEAMGRRIQQSQPFGTPEWQILTATRMKMLSRLKPLGRPKKTPKNAS
jgi:REP-associated tyrosine transposase